MEVAEHSSVKAAQHNLRPPATQTANCAQLEIGRSRNSRICFEYIPGCENRNMWPVLGMITSFDSAIPLSMISVAPQIIWRKIPHIIWRSMRAAGCANLRRSRNRNGRMRSIAIDSSNTILKAVFRSHPQPARPESPFGRRSAGWPATARMVCQGWPASRGRQRWLFYPAVAPGKLIELLSRQRGRL